MLHVVISRCTGCMQLVAVIVYGVKRGAGKGVHGNKDRIAMHLAFPAWDFVLEWCGTGCHVQGLLLCRRHRGQGSSAGGCAIQGAVI